MDELEDFLRHDLWWQSQKCIEAGLADEIWTEKSHSKDTQGRGPTSSPSGFRLVLALGSIESALIHALIATLSLSLAII
jgi:hypothetical protein